MKRAASTTAINTYSSRRYWLSSLLLGIALPLSWTANADATTNIFLKWSDGSIFGDSVQHPGDVVLTSYSQSDSNPVNLARAAGGAASGRPTCGQVTIMKQLDKTSPDFLMKVLEGSVTSSTTPVTITFEQPFGDGGSRTYYQVQLYEVAVTSITQNDNQADIVTETIQLEAGKFRFTYTPQGPAASGSPISFGYDCLRNRAL